MSNVHVERIKAAKNSGQVMDALIACPTQEDAIQAMNAYRAACAHADQNVGYMLGYYSAETEARLQGWLGLTHPIFGKGHPSPAEAFLAGQAAAKGGQA